MSGSTSDARTTNPIGTGVLLAMLAALTFGVSTPLIQRAGRGVGPFATAALLYAGAALASMVRPRRGTEAPLRRAHLIRIGFVAVIGAVGAPVLLAWGLQRTSGASASLTLNLEVFFTAALARALYREHLGMRAVAAMMLMIVAATVLVTESSSGPPTAALGLLAVAGATLGWALDNALTRPLADLDPSHVVFWKAGLGAMLSLGASRVLQDPLPTVPAAAALIGCGAIGYGVSLRLYLLAQRTLGAGRTASIFALAPFIGAAVALGLGEKAAGAPLAAAGLLFAGGVYLHASEEHGHVHTHEPMEHEHAHRHDDGHHDHEHAEVVVGSHSHPHRHDDRTHEHPHAPDVHHRHGHD